MLNSKDIPGADVQKRLLKCNGKSYDITNNSMPDLVENIQAIARKNGISRFDIYDSEEKNLSPDDIKSGNFSGDLMLQIENIL